MQSVIPLYIGADPREAAGLHVFIQSVMDSSSAPVAFVPLHKPMLEGFDGQRDGTNAFIYSRFLVPHLQHYEGWALFADGSDMVCLEDLKALWAMRDDRYAVQVVKHDYKTKHGRKYLGTPMEADNLDYPKKNNSSFILWNCGHYANRRLTPELVAESPGSFLHRFQWLSEDQIGEIPADWNALVGEQDISSASLLHFTLGAPGFANYSQCDGADHWHRALLKAVKMEGEKPSELIRRAHGK
jgi:lipopolysaccharide biosynthesis glycosyltransferase